MACAAQTRVIRDLNTEWDHQLAPSALLARRMREWAADDPELDFDDVDGLLAAAAHREPGARECPVLDRLVVLAAHDELALRVVVQAMLPRWCALINTLRGDVDDVAALVVTVGCEMILSCPPDTAGTPTDWRLWSNTRRKVLRVLERERRRPERPTVPAELERPVDSASEWDDHAIEELMDWVCERARVDLGAARLVVMTRVGGVPLVEVAAASGVPAATLRQRRHRTERRLAAAC